MGGGLSINEQKHDKKSNIRFLEFSKFESCGRYIHVHILKLQRLNCLICILKQNTSST